MLGSPWLWPLYPLWVRAPHVSSVFLCLCVCVKHRRLPAWWMPLFVAQVRRHPWWDRPTVHHSLASTSLPPLLRRSPAHLHPFSPSHCGCTWQMAYTRKGSPISSQFSSTTGISSPFHLIVSFATSIFAPLSHPSLTEGWWLMNVHCFFI